jgi:hypothetical protein
MRSGTISRDAAATWLFISVRYSVPEKSESAVYREHGQDEEEGGCWSRDLHRRCVILESKLGVERLKRRHREEYRDREYIVDSVFCEGRNLLHVEKIESNWTPEFVEREPRVKPKAQSHTDRRPEYRLSNHDALRLEIGDGEIGQPEYWGIEGESVDDAEPGTDDRNASFHRAQPGFRPMIGNSIFDEFLPVAHGAPLSGDQIHAHESGDQDQQDQGP